ncbi:MAG: iron-containing redox enzyme family protein, partial [Rhizomicrobium sp.]
MLHIVPCSGPQADFAGPETISDDDARQYALSHFNRIRLLPGLGEVPDADAVRTQRQALARESRFLAEARAEIAPMLQDVPSETNAFIAWFERLQYCGPGQGDPLFPWLAEQATLDQMRWFLSQEVAGEAGFDDLVALTQVKMP